MCVKLLPSSEYHKHIHKINSEVNTQTLYISGIDPWISTLKTNSQKRDSRKPNLKKFFAHIPKGFSFRQLQ